MPVMDTEKEKPFSFELLAVVHDISNQLFRYQEFFLAVEELFTECSGSHNLRFWEASAKTFIGGCASIGKIDGV
jgi:hypothetical protein